MNSIDLRNIFYLYFIAIFGYNMLCALITFMLNSVWHAILDNFRPITVWGCDLLIYYTITTTLGEPWSIYSYIQVFAMFVLLYGTAVYNAPNSGSVMLTGGITSFYLDFSDEYKALALENSNSNSNRDETAKLTGDDDNRVRAMSITSSPHYHHTSPFRTGASPALNRDRLLRKDRADSMLVEQAKINNKMNNNNNNNNNSSSRGGYGAVATGAGEALEMKNIQNSQRQGSFA